MFDDRPEIGIRLQDELVAWLTTVNAAGQPQPSVIWFVVEDDHFVIYSKEGTPRLRNIRHDARVAVHLNTDEVGDSVLIFEGEAEIIGKDVPPSQHGAYATKYERHLSRWDFTWQTYDAGFPVRIHVRPARVRS